MKLKNEFVTQTIGDKQIMVAAEGASFKGIVRSNESAAFIVDCLKRPTTQEAIVAAMLQEYDAPVGVIAADVERILNILRGIGALDE